MNRFTGILQGGEGMGAKQDKRIRRIARDRYEWQIYHWQMNKPAKWRIFKYRKWKKQKPVYQHTEKQIKKLAKKKGGA